MKAGSVVVPESQHDCVVYRKSDGKIVHSHSVIVLPGAKEVTKDEVETRARRIANGKGHNNADLSVLHVDRTAMRPNEKYKVDVNNRTVISAGADDRVERKTRSS